MMTTARRSTRPMTDRVLVMDVKSTLCGLLLCACASLAAADCQDAQSQAEMNQCAHATYEREDAALNLAYSKYRSGLSADEQRMLKSAQAQWIRFRDLACAFETSSVAGGSMHPMVHSLCLADYTRERRQRIEDLASCKHAPSPGKACTH